MVDAVVGAQLPAVGRDYLNELVTSAQWAAAGQAVTALRACRLFARFADDVDWGVLLGPGSPPARYPPADAGGGGPRSAQ